MYSLFLAKKKFKEVDALMVCIKIIYIVFLRIKLRPFSSRGRCFTDWAISPVLSKHLTGKFYVFAVSGVVLRAHAENEEQNVHKTYCVSVRSEKLPISKQNNIDENNRDFFLFFCWEMKPGLDASGEQ